MRIIAAVLIVLISVLAACTWRSEDSADHVLLDGRPIPFCEVKADPRKFSGKTFRIEAKLHWFMHGNFFYDEECPEPLDSKSSDSHRVAVTLVRHKRDELYELIDQVEDPKDKYKPIAVVAVGKFSYSTVMGTSDGIEDRTPMHFEIHTIESAELLPYSLLDPK